MRCPHIVGHRGARGLYPENTLLGFRRALALGVDALELDLGISRDGVVMVYHDRRLSRDTTRDARGAWLGRQTPTLWSVESAELARLDVGRARPGGRVAANFPAQQAADGERMPALDELFQWFVEIGRPPVRLILEAKLTPQAPRDTPTPAAFAEAVVRAVERHRLRDCVVLQSFDWRFVREALALEPRLEVSCLTARRPWLNNVGRRLPGASPWTAGIDFRRFGGSVPDGVRAIGARHWSPYHGDLDDASLARAHALGLEVLVWTVNETAEMSRLMDLGVDAIITDFPDRLRGVLEGRGCPLPPALGADPVRPQSGTGTT
jgi:glycerophosphoryl diester phosphodiesterase